MTNIKLVVIALSIAGVVGSANSTSVIGPLDLGVAVLGPFGGQTKLCFFHGDPISIVDYAVLCDVAVLDDSQRANLLSSGNQEYARVIIEEGPLAHMVIHVIDSGDPDCYTQKTTQHYKPPNW